MVDSGLHRLGAGELPWTARGGCIHIRIALGWPGLVGLLEIFMRRLGYPGVVACYGVLFFNSTCEVRILPGHDPEVPGICVSNLGRCASMVDLLSFVRS